MFMMVDLPAPFSPITPTMLPAGIAMLTPRLACTGPKLFAMPRSSRASAIAAPVAFVVMHLQLAGNDVGLGLVDPGFHLRGDELAVVLVIGPIDAAFLQAADAVARL